MRTLGAFLKQDRKCAAHIAVLQAEGPRMPEETRKFEWLFAHCDAFCRRLLLCAAMDWQPTMASVGCDAKPSILMHFPVYGMVLG